MPLKSRNYKSDKNESVTAVEKPQNVFVKAVHAVESDENEDDEEFVNGDSESDEALETPQDVLTKIMNSCNSLIQEQEKCFRLWRSEANPDYETERLIGALEELHAELKSHRDLLTENLGRALAKNSVLTKLMRELERLLNLANKLTQKGSLPVSGDSIVSSLENQWYTIGELVDQCPILVDMRSTSRHTKRSVVSSRAKTAVVKEREAETADATKTNVDDMPELFVGSVSARDGDKNGNYGEFFCPNLWEEVLTEPNVCDTTIYVLGKINTLCDTLLGEQESCVQFIESRDDTISQTVDLIDTLEDLQAELKSYRDLLINDLSHAPAMNRILEGMQKDIGRLLDVAEKLTHSASYQKTER